MKKFIFLLVGAFCYLTVSAQGGFYFGVKGEAGLDPFYNEKWFRQGPEFRPAIAWGAGGSIGYNAVYYNYGVTLGGFYKTYAQKFLLNRAKDQPANETAYLRVDYFEAPLMMRFRPSGDNRTKQITLGGPYFEIGVLPSMLLSTSTAKHIDTLGNLQKFDKIEENFEKYNIGAMIGFGWHQVGTPNWSITHGFRINYSFLDIVKSPQHMENIHQDLLTINADYSKTTLLGIRYVLTIYYKFPKMK